MNAEETLKKQTNMKESTSIFTHLYYKQEIIIQFEKYFSLIVFYATPPVKFMGKKELMASGPVLMHKQQQPFPTSVQEEAAVSTPSEYTEYPEIHGGFWCTVLLWLLHFLGCSIKLRILIS